MVLITRKIDTGNAQVISPIGWLPDNQTIVYSVYGEGFTFIMHNLQSGDTKKLFTAQTKNGFGAISPDGQWIAFPDRVFGGSVPSYIHFPVGWLGTQALGIYRIFQLLSIQFGVLMEIGCWTQPMIIQMVAPIQHTIQHTSQC